MVVGLLLVGVVVGAAVGGTLASKRSKTTSTSGDSSPAASTPSATPSAEPTTPPPKSIRQNSSLAVTAWRKVNGVEIYLFFQGPDNIVYRSTYDSASGPTTGNSSSLWQPPVAATTQAEPTSPLGATTIVHEKQFQVSIHDLDFPPTRTNPADSPRPTGCTQQPQIQLYHISSPNNHLTGTNFNEQSQPTVQIDDVNGFNLVTHPSSRIGCYWPYIIYQDANNNYIELRITLDESGTLAPEPGANARNLQVVGAEGSRIAVVPLSTLFSTTARRGGYGIVGQASGGDLVAFIPDEKQTTNVTRSWSTGLSSFS